MRLIFRPKSEFQTIFQADSQHVLHNFGTQFSLGEGCFQFFTKNRPQKHQKGAILHTSQANGELDSPPGYATENNRLFSSLSSDLQSWSKFGFVVFYRECTKLATGVSFVVLVASSIATVGVGALYSPNDCLFPPFWFTQNAFLEHQVTSRQQAIMGKG